MYLYQTRPSETLRTVSQQDGSRQKPTALTKHKVNNFTARKTHLQSPSALTTDSSIAGEHFIMSDVLTGVVKEN